MPSHQQHQQHQQDQHGGGGMSDDGDAHQPLEAQAGDGGGGGEEEEEEAGAAVFGHEAESEFFEPGMTQMVAGATQLDPGLGASQSSGVGAQQASATSRKTT